MDPNGPTASALQSEFGFIPGRATPGTYPKLQQIITGAHCPSGSGWRSDDTTPRVLHSSDDGSTPRSRSELSFHSWALSGQSSAQASSLRSETPTSNGHAPILADVCMSRGQGSTASCGGAAATTQPSSHETPNREENLLKRALPREPSQDQHGDSSTPVQPGIKKAKKERRPGPEDHLPWTERKIRRAKRAARSELSVTRGEWCAHCSAVAVYSIDPCTQVAPLVGTYAACLTSYFAVRVKLVPCLPLECCYVSHNIIDLGPVAAQSLTLPDTVALCISSGRNTTTLSQMCCP